MLKVMSPPYVHLSVTVHSFGQIGLMFCNVLVPVTTDENTSAVVGQRSGCITKTRQSQTLDVQLVLVSA